MLMVARTLRRMAAVTSCAVVAGLATTCGNDATKPQLPGAAARLAFLDPPGGVAAWDTIAPAVRVGVLDRFGNVTDTPVTVTLTIAGATGALGAALVGASSRLAVDGIATFPDLGVDRGAAGYRLIASAAGLIEATSAAFDVGPERPTLAFATEPSDVAPGRVMTPALRIVVGDHRGGPVDGAAVVTVTLDAGPSGAGLHGTTVRRAVNGVATFDDLVVDKPGNDLVLTATSGGLRPAISGAFRGVSPHGGEARTGVAGGGANAGRAR